MYRRDGKDRGRTAPQKKASLSWSGAAPVPPIPTPSTVRPTRSPDTLGAGPPPSNIPTRCRSIGEGADGRSRGMWAGKRSRSLRRDRAKRAHWRDGVSTGARNVAEGCPGAGALASLRRSRLAEGDCLLAGSGNQFLRRSSHELSGPMEPWCRPRLVRPALGQPESHRGRSPRPARHEERLWLRRWPDSRPRRFDAPTARRSSPQIVFCHSYGRPFQSGILISWGSITFAVG